MSAHKTSSSSSSLATMGMATTSLDLDPCSCWLCRTFPWSHVSHTHWCTFQMDGSEMYYLSYFSYRHWAYVNDFFNILVTRNVGGWQWFSFHMLRAQKILGNGFRHVTWAPYHPTSNGLTERAIQTFKEHMLRTTEGTINTHLSRFLFHNCNTPHIYNNRNITSRVNVWKKTKNPIAPWIWYYPTLLTEFNVNKRIRNLYTHDKTTKETSFKVGNAAYIPNSKKWLPGKIVKALGPLSFEIETKIITKWWNQCSSAHRPFQIKIHSNQTESKHNRSTTTRLDQVSRQTLTPPPDDSTDETDSEPPR